jgi:hypothetical protein
MVREAGDSEYHGGFLHAWMNGHFHTLDDGRRVFYPQGPLGRRGYEVASTEQELILRINVRGCQRLISVLLLIGTFAIIFSMRSLESWLLLPIVVGGWLATWALAKAYYWSFTRTMQSVCAQFTYCLRQIHGTNRPSSPSHLAGRVRSCSERRLLHHGLSGS